MGLVPTPTVLRRVSLISYSSGERCVSLIVYVQNHVLVGHLDPRSCSCARRIPQLLRTLSPTRCPRLAPTHNAVRPRLSVQRLIKPHAHLIIHSLLLFASGVPTAEKPTAQRYYKMTYPDDDSENGHDYHERQPANGAWANYQRYRAQTSILVPLPPALYRALPMWVKRTFLLELPIYEWTPGTAL